MAESPKEFGFGFVPAESEHHFLVIIPAGKKEEIVMLENFQYDENPARLAMNLSLGKENLNVRIILSHPKWEAIAGEVQAEFNRRLKKIGLKPGQWKAGHIPVSRLLGKELVLLAWAIEDADPALIPMAIRNWLGLKPEERWWLYTMTNAATGHAIYGRNKGWRKAIRYALTENPISESYKLPTMEFFKVADEDKAWLES